MLGYHISFHFKVSNSISDGGSSIVAQLAAAQQNQFINHTKPYSASTHGSLTSGNNKQPQIHAAKTVPLKPSTIASSLSGANLASTIVMANSTMMPANGVMVPSNTHIVDHERNVLLRDYVNLPPPPPYPGTSTASNVTMSSSVSQCLPNHGHSTSNLSQGSNGMYDYSNYI